ncbi:MAG: chromosome segregation protein SMC [Eubacterium sp.]|nr:chromosome segregation protein SMC [Eubacterium sp.]
MYLKSIEVNGFKSFANKITFEFPHGITGIVGPNGSGKSNIGDAVRWVLGEQSARQLRGSRMEDVIFSGTQSRRPMGFAYVAITFDNSSHLIPVDYEEVTVARRVYRSGESEYILNGTVCRRRDIVDLFYDTGIGKEGYSIIGQGQVEKILSGKIEDSRDLFDEAAGIAKYKKNRAMTSKALEQEQQNLERVGDILSELSQRVGPLEKQSEKAREYLRLKDREKDLDLHLFLYDHDRIRKELVQNESQSEIIQGDLENARDAYEEIKKKNQAITDRADEINARIESVEASRETLRSQKEENENKLLISENQIQANAQMISHYRELCSQVQEDTDSKIRRQEETSALIESKEKTLSQKDSDLKALEEAIEEAGKDQASCESRIRTRNQELFDLMSIHSDRKEQLSRYEAMEEQLQIRHAQYQSRLLAIRSSRADQESQASQLAEAIKKSDESLKKAESDLTRLEEEQAEKGRALSEANREENRINQNYLQAKSRYDTLRQMTERYEGYNRTIRVIMEQKATHPDIIGVVADIMRLDRKYETAIEIALGGALQNIVTENSRAARDMIRFLKKNRYGRATFLPLTDIRRRNSSLNPMLLEEEGVIDIASRLVQVEDKYRNLADSLLGRTIVVDDMDHALALSRKNNFSLRIVTLDGELLNPGGSITGGAFKHAGNLLGRKREIEENREQMESLSRQLNDCRDERDRISREQKEGTAALEKQQAEVHRQELALHDLKAQMDALTLQTEETDRQAATLKKEHQILKEQIDEIARQKKDLARDQEDQEAISRENTSSLEDLRADLDRINAGIEELEQKKNDLRLEISGLETELGFLKEECERLQKEILSGQESIRQYKEDAQALTMENKTLEEAREEAGKKTALYDAGILEAEDDLTVLKQQRSEFSRKQKLIFQEIEDENSRLLSLEKESSRLTARHEKISSELDSLIEYMWEEYEYTYSQAASMKKYDIVHSQAGAKRREKKEIQRSIRDLGSVNVNAIEEYKEVGERYAFLTKQYTDIQEAEARLMTMIDELNQAMRKQFREKFEEIRTMFSKVFIDLFEGGTADLELMDTEDILECGIRIIAQPPGKKLQNILLLSGGERALTAIALLFAIQNLKPSPFCLLDEIEAALDDANIIRFSRYLKRLSKDTQFIVITHRRGTMSAADSLYGITMQEKGISTLISVDLIDHQLKE